jgi:hypothetical protein
LDTGLQRQKIRQQTAVEEIDCQGATGDVRAAHMLISSRNSPDVATGAMGGHDEFAYGRGVAQTEIEALHEAFAPLVSIERHRSEYPNQPFYSRWVGFQQNKVSGQQRLTRKEPG